VNRSRTAARSSGFRAAPTQTAQPHRTPEPLAVPSATPRATPTAAPSAETTVAERSAPDIVTPTEAEPLTALAVATSNLFDAPTEAGNPFGASFDPASSAHKLGRNALRGSRDSLVRQNERAEADDLERIEDDADLADRIAHGVLVPVPESPALAVNPGLPEDRRYCRPWTASFLVDLARAHDGQFHRPLIVSSAVRTVEYQRHLMRRNHNAAAAEGDIVSPHLTGATIDIAKSGMSRRQLAWMRGRLLPLQNQGLIDVEEEFRQACFHITVYKDYAPDQPVRAAAKLPSDANDRPATSETVSNSQ
jgi:hypothetical protein